MQTKIVIRKFAIGWCVDRIDSALKIHKIFTKEGLWRTPGEIASSYDKDSFETKQEAEVYLMKYFAKRPKLEFAKYIAEKILA